MADHPTYEEALAVALAERDAVLVFMVNCGEALRVTTEMLNEHGFDGEHDHRDCLGDITLELSRMFKQHGVSKELAEMFNGIGGNGSHN